LLVAVWSFSARAAPVLSGVYHVGSIGLVEFELQNNETVGRYRAGGECAFTPQEVVVRGTFQGNVFIGQVVLCQSGVGCPTSESFPMLGFWRNDQMLAQIKFAPGCGSKATDNSQLLFVPATVEDKKALEGVGSAAALASKNRPTLAMVDDAIREGQKLNNEGKYAQARRQFDLAISGDETNFAAWYGLGTALLGLTEFVGAADHLERSIRNAPPNASREVLGMAHFNLGLAYAQLNRKPSALKALKEAARLLGAENILADFESEPKLNPLRGEKDFQQILASLRKTKKGK
jgi:tetratricopeptide (TPR) repeat protein